MMNQQGLGFDIAPELNPELSQYHTPKRLAEKMAKWAGVTACMRVLDPAAGGGALLKPCIAVGAEVMGLDIDPAWIEQMQADPELDGAATASCNFLETIPEQIVSADAVQLAFDLCLQNPPFEKQNDARFIAHSLLFAPRCVALVPASVLFGIKKHELLWRRHSLVGLVHLISRPKFTGQGGMFDCVVVEVTRGRGHPCTRVERWGGAW